MWRTVGVGVGAVMEVVVVFYRDVKVFTDGMGCVVLEFVLSVGLTQ